MELYGASWQKISFEPVPLKREYMYVQGEVHIFCSRVPEEINVIEQWLSLSGIEKAHFSSKESLSSHRLVSLFMRYFLGALCLKESPGNLRFRRTPAGKPSLWVSGNPVPLHFSQSHTRDYVLTAVGDMECGIDVESIRSPLAYPRLVHRGLPGEWRVELDATRGEAASAHLFTSYWTALESLFKMTGGSSFISFLRTLAQDSDVPAKKERLAGVWGASFDLDGNHLACLTALRRPDKLHCFSMSTTSMSDFPQLARLEKGSMK